jgi:hypothetical protein
MQTNMDARHNGTFVAVRFFGAKRQSCASAYGKIASPSQAWYRKRILRTMYVCLVESRRVARHFDLGSTCSGVITW